MYQTTIRNKKKSTNITKPYLIEEENNEEYALSVKLLGNCRVSLLTNTGSDVIGIIRGNMRKFNKRVLIVEGDIVAISKREFQSNKVDIVHKYNSEQTQNLINKNVLSDILINNYYKNSNKIDSSEDTHIIFDNNDNSDDKNINLNKSYVDFKFSSDSEDDIDDI